MHVILLFHILSNVKITSCNNMVIVSATQGSLVRALHAVTTTIPHITPVLVGARK